MSRVIIIKVFFIICYTFPYYQHMLLVFSALKSLMISFECCFIPGKSSKLLAMLAIIPVVTVGLGVIFV